MTCMTYSPSSAASKLKSQNNSTSPHGPGGKVPKPMDSVGVGSGMGYSPKTGVKVLNGQNSKVPNNAGPQKTY